MYKVHSRTLKEALNTQHFLEYYQRLGKATKGIDKARSAHTLLEFVNFLDEAITDITLFRNTIITEVNSKKN